MRKEVLNVMIDLLTKEKDGEESSLVCSETKPHPFKIGQKYFFRLVTHYISGRITGVYGDFIELEDSAWIADTGRFSDALKKGEFSEVEPIFGVHGLNMTAIIDYFEWNHKLPREQKQ